jgi:hypothetical protein
MLVKRRLLKGGNKPLVNGAGQMLPVQAKQCRPTYIVVHMLVVWLENSVLKKTYSRGGLFLRITV